MEEVFKRARAGRRRSEFTLTSAHTNAFYYGSPAHARKKNIWPPLASDLELKEAALLDSTQSRKEWLRTANKERATSLTAFPQLPAEENPERLYEPLCNGTKIRILELGAGKLHDDLKCNFHYIDLSQPPENCPTYEALSYVWGDNSSVASSEQHPNSPCLLYFHSHKVPIRANLETALRSLRFESSSRTLWVDAVCINQDDIEEREHQISLMSAVYGNARQVIAWLGEGPGEQSFRAICEVVNHWLGSSFRGQRATYRMATNSNNSMRSSLQLPSNAPMHWWESWNKRFLNNIIKTRSSNRRYLQATLQSASTSAFWKAIQELFECTYFWRLWIFQEIVLATAAIVKCGHFEMKWEWIGLAAAILRTNYHDICDNLKMGGVYNAYLMFRSSRLSDLSPLKLDFLRLLRLTRQFEVSDPRDRVYGLLGITTNDNQPATASLFLTPDYNTEDGELWKRLAIKVLTDSRDLSILSSVQYHTGKLECEKGRTSSFGFNETRTNVMVPSWVPQWSHVFRTTLSPSDVDDRFSASKDLQLTFGKPLETGVLSVEGVNIGIIGHATWFMWNDLDISFLWSTHLRPFFQSREGLMLLARTLTAGRDSYGSVVGIDEAILADFVAYLSTLRGEETTAETSHGRWVRDGTHMSRPTHEEIMELLSDLDLKPFQDLARKGHAARFSETAVRFCQSRRLFLTFNGFLGLGPESLREGDRLCVLAGGDLPFILRPMQKDTGLPKTGDGASDDTSSEGSSVVLVNSDGFLLVGECYVEGLMKGEAVGSLLSDRNLVGPLDPELVMLEILEKAGKPLRGRHWSSDAEDRDENDRNPQLVYVARKEFEGVQKERLVKRWYDIH